MRLNDTLEKAFNDQITMELTASNVYRQLAIELDYIDLPGMAAWMRAQAAEESRREQEEAQQETPSAPDNGGSQTNPPAGDNTGGGGNTGGGTSSVSPVLSGLPNPWEYAGCFV